MEMTIADCINYFESTIDELAKEGQYCDVFEMVVDTMRKYQKIEDIVRDYYNEQYTDKLDIEIIEMISEVLCDGNVD